MTATRDHFSLEEWADFVRGRVQPEDRTRMERHLEQGCAECATTLESWEGVLAVAGREAAFEPPNNVLRCARALYSAFPPQRRTGLSLRVAGLAHYMPQASEGVRAVRGPAGVHLLFREGTLLLDVRLRPKLASESISLMGQVLDSAKLGAPLGNRIVSVLRASDALTQTTTNEFGEFRLEFEPAEDLFLVVQLENKSYLVSHLPGPEE